MTARQNLPNRRPALVINLEHDRLAYTASIGFDLTGRPREIFARCRKPNSAMDLIADDLSVVLSLALQHGIEPGALRHSIGRIHGKPASLAGALIDALAEVSP